jgi:hypothetical protein
VGGTSAPEHLTPSVVPNLSEVVEVSLGERHLCARLRSGNVVCIGPSEVLEADHAPWSDPRRREEVVRSTIQGLEGVVKLTSLDDATCALRADGSVVCWEGRRLPQTVSLPMEERRPDETENRKD